MSVLGGVHSRYVHTRRVDRLSSHLASLLPESADVLDVGCGDGELARRIFERRPDVNVSGIDILVRQETAIPVNAFDGRRIPYPSDSLDAIMFVDVLHHAEDPVGLLREAARTARKAVLIKDHLREGIGAHATLSLMDWVGNARYGVRLPYRYWTRNEWHHEFRSAGLEVVHWREKLSLYPPPASLFFDRSLHFVACLRPT